jgi:hypothetical protein
MFSHVLIYVPIICLMLHCICSYSCNHMRVLIYVPIIWITEHSEHIMGLFGWAVAVKKVAVGCELWKKLL